MGLPLFVFSEPDPIKKITSKEFDPIMCGPVKAIPEGYTIYDKVVIDRGSITFQQLFDIMKEEKGLEVSMVASGKIAMYNAYLPGNKHAGRLSQKIEDVYRDIDGNDFPKGRYYMIIELGGETVDGEDFTMPPVKYCFKPRD